MIFLFLTPDGVDANWSNSSRNRRPQRSRFRRRRRVRLRDLGQRRGVRSTRRHLDGDRFHGHPKVSLIRPVPYLFQKLAIWFIFVLFKKRFCSKTVGLPKLELIL